MPLLAENTWEKRLRRLPGAEGVLPPASIIIVPTTTSSSIGFAEEYLPPTRVAHFEVIVVDNASSGWYGGVSHGGIRKVSSSESDSQPGQFGFAAASNQGLRQAIGEYLVLLNNDTSFLAAGFPFSFVTVRRSRNRAHRPRDK